MSGAMVAPKTAAALLAKHLEAARPRIQMVLPPRMSVDRIIATAQNMYARDPALAECDPGSVVRAVVQAAELGLDLSPKLGQCYLIPRNVKVGGGWVKRCELQVGYKGMLSKVFDSERILSLDVELVHEGDRFELNRGTHPNVVHTYGLTQRGRLIGGYCAARLTPPDAVPPVWKVTHMTLEEIESIRDHADSYRKWKQAKDQGRQWHAPPWVEHFDEMAKKTILIRACKTLPIGDTFRKALEGDADDMRAARAASVDPGPTRTDALKEKLGIQAPGVDAVDAELDEEEPT